MQHHHFVQQLKNTLLKPKQVMVLDADSRKPAKNLRIRPVILLIIPVAFMLLGSLLSYQLTPRTISPSIVPEHIQLQQKFDKMNARLAMSEAGNDVKQAQIDSLEQALEKQQKNITTLNKRIHVFESILEARKAHGSQLLQASIHPIDMKRIEYSLTLVKGGSYPRYTRGFIQFVAQNKQGKKITLLFENNKDTLPYKMETHTFLRGKLHWPDMIAVTDSIQNITFTAILLSTKGKELSRKPCTLEEQ